MALDSKYTPYWFGSVHISALQSLNTAGLLKDGINKLAVQRSDVATSLKACHSYFVWRWLQI